MQTILLEKEKKTNIPIPIPILKRNDNTQYLLTQNIFDPAKGSPPNEFIIKLHMRMAYYQKMNVERR